jgi:hypothetical protein
MPNGLRVGKSSALIVAGKNAATASNVKSKWERNFILFFSIATAAAAAHARAAGGHFAGKVNVFQLGLAQRIAIAAHRVVGQRAALPGFHGFAAGLRADEDGQQRWQDEFLEAWTHKIIF